MSANAWDRHVPSAAGVRGRTVRAGSTGRSGTEVAYDRLALRFAERFHAGDDVGLERIWSALDEARAAMVADGTLTPGQAAAAARWLLADLAQLALQRSTLSGPRSSARLEGAAASLAAVLATSDAWLPGLAAVSPPRARRMAGEVTCAGVIACRKCGRTSRLEHSTLLPACASCAGDVFSRGTA